MVGHAVNAYTDEQEDRVLLGKMVPLFGPGGRGGPCLLMTASGNGTYKYPQLACWRAGDKLYVGARYDDLCHRFGTQRVNSAIRNRILSNQLRRVLQNRPVHTVSR